MCGILGLINFPLNENEVINALSTLKHRALLEAKGNKLFPKKHSISKIFAFLTSVNLFVR